MNINTRLQYHKKWPLILFFLSAALFSSLFSKSVLSHISPEISPIAVFAVGFFLLLLAGRLHWEQKRADQKYRQLESLTNCMNGGIVTYALDKKLSILYANDGYYKLIGYSRREVREKFNNSGLPFMGADELLAQLLNKDNEENEYVNMEFQLPRKDGQSVWIRANCQRTRNPHGCDTLSYMMIDITDSKKNEQALLLEKERYHIATELTNDIIFEYDIKADILSSTTKYQKIFGRAPLIENFSKHLKHASWISPSTRPALKELRRNFIAGQATMTVELQLLDAQQKYTWCHIRSQTVYDDAGLPYKIIGKIVNIDAQKKALENLHNQACRDPLTKLYNKTVTKNMIDNILQTRPTKTGHALMIVDIDNFKSVNDTLGHLTGDEALIEVTARLQSLCEKSDIVGRIGGDEFIVFMPNIVSAADIFEKARAISRALHADFCDQGKTCHISGSIGIALFPQDGASYHELVEKADQALYQIKKQGKDNFTFTGKSKQLFQEDFPEKLPCT